MHPKQKLKLSSDNKSKNRFYVYYHVDDKGNIFYIGKGYYDRAYQKRSRSKEWENVVSKCKDGYGVCFFVFGLTDKKARDLEKELITEGFKQGLPLVNKTHGGQGVSKPLTASKKKELRVKRCKRVYCYQTGKVYYGTSHAAEELNLHGSHVGYCCNNKSKQAKGYEFDFLENVDVNELGVIRKKAVNEKKAIKIYCEQNGRIYNSIYEASNHLKLHNTHIKRQLSKQIKHIKGYSFLYYKKNMQLIKKPFHSKKHIKVICVNNQKQYSSLSAASRDLNVDCRKIKEVCDNKRESYKGLIFRYIDF